MVDVFSREVGISGDTGRICKVGRTPQAVRVRSHLVWVGVHWVDGPFLCAGSGCHLCEAAVPHRRKAWLAVDRPNGTLAALEITVSDCARFEGACAADALTLRPGVSLVLRRPGERQPLTVDAVRFYAGIGEVSQDVLMLDVLRFHGVMATPADIRDGSYRDHVRRRTREVAAKMRSLT